MEIYRRFGVIFYIPLHDTRRRQQVTWKRWETATCLQYKSYVSNVSWTPAYLRVVFWCVWWLLRAERNRQSQHSISQHALWYTCSVTDWRVLRSLETAPVNEVLTWRIPTSPFSTHSAMLRTVFLMTQNFKKTKIVSLLSALIYSPTLPSGHIV